MGKLSTVAVDELHTALDRVSTGKAAKRLMIALRYIDDASVKTLSKRCAIDRILLAQSLRGDIDREGD